jgi:hypothetical protein
MQWNIGRHCPLGEPVHEYYDGRDQEEILAHGVSSLCATVHAQPN